MRNRLSRQHFCCNKPQDEFHCILLDFFANSTYSYCIKLMVYKS